MPELVRPNRYLYVHRDPAQLNVDKGLAWRLRRERGAEIEVLDGQALRDAEPELSPDYTRGVLLGPMGFTLNPFRLTQAYARAVRAERRVAAARRSDGAAARGLARDGRDRRRPPGWPRASSSRPGPGPPDSVKPLGTQVPIIAERGYHMTFANPGIKLNHVISEVELQFAVTPMEMGLRVAGTEELGNADDAAGLAPRRRAEAASTPHVPEGQPRNSTRWMGPRPGTPDSCPRSARCPDIRISSSRQAMAIWA